MPLLLAEYMLFVYMLLSIELSFWLGLDIGRGINETGRVDVFGAVDFKPAVEQNFPVFRPIVILNKVRKASMNSSVAKGVIIVS